MSSKNILEPVLSEKDRNDLLKVSVKFSFKNDSSQTFDIFLTEAEAELFKDACIQAVGAEKSWFNIPDSRKKGRFILVNISEVLHISTTI